MNIAEILKNCPEGIELYSPVFGVIRLMEVADGCLSISKQDEHKFDPLSLNPYDKVLIKEDEEGCWVPTLISYVTTSEVFTIDKNDSVSYVIPYEPNKHLIGKWDDPDKYYITW